LKQHSPGVETAFPGVETTSPGVETAFPGVETTSPETQGNIRKKN